MTAATAAAWRRGGAGGRVLGASVSLGGAPALVHACVVCVGRGQGEISLELWARVKVQGALKGQRPLLVLIEAGRRHPPSAQMLQPRLAAGGAQLAAYAGSHRARSEVAMMRWADG